MTPPQLKLLLVRAPIVACAGSILFLFIASLWNVLIESNWPKLRIRSAAPLAGLGKLAPAEWSLGQFISGETQKAVSANFSQSLPVFPIAVRLRNQLVFSLLGRSPTPGVVVGRDGVLFERVYVDEFCGRDAEFAASRVGEWAAAISEISAKLEERGVRFVYLFSPSKAALYPGRLPPGACPATGPTHPDKVAPFAEALREHKVPHVDGVSLMSRSGTAYPFPLFARGGSHWGAVGAGLALREITLTAPCRMGLFEFDWTPSSHALGDDSDLVGLLNLLRPDLAYPTAAIHRKGAAAQCAGAPRVVAIGTSFLNQIIIDAAQAPCPPEVEQWFQMRQPDGSYALHHYFHPAGDVTRGEPRGVDAAELASNLAWAELVILEENERALPDSPQVAQLRAAVRDYAARGSRQ